MDGSFIFLFLFLSVYFRQIPVGTPIHKFISQILIHLPPKNFKMISRFGFYARKKSHKLIKAIKEFKNAAAASKFS